MFSYALAQGRMLEKFERFKQSERFAKLEKCNGRWDGNPDKITIKRSQVGIGDHLLSQSNGCPGSVSPDSVSGLFEVKNVDGKALNDRVIEKTVGRINLGFKTADV